MDRRFAWGVGLVVVSVFLGVAYKFFFLARFLGTTDFQWTSVKSYFQDPVTAWATALYLVSWLMLFLGIYLCGKEGVRYATRFTKYVSYRYYHRQAKKHVPRLARRGMRETKRMVKRTRRMVDESGKRAGRFVEQGARRTRRMLEARLHPKKKRPEKAI